MPKRSGWEILPRMAVQPGVEHVGFVSRNPEHTRIWVWAGRSRHAGDVILLRGPLAQENHPGSRYRSRFVSRHVTSPSFTLVNEYEEGSLYTT